MQIQELKRNNLLTKKRRIGRGGVRGKTAGRGTKGQKARAGHKIRPEIRDLIKKIPKQRGYRFNSIRSKSETINVSDLNAVFKDKEVITPASLVAKGLIKRINGKLPSVKILGKGKLDRRNLTVSRCEISASAGVKLAKTGAKIESLL